MVNKKSVGEVTTITQENRLIASVSGLFTIAVVLAMRIGSSVARGTLLAPLQNTGLYVKFWEHSLLTAQAVSGQKDIIVADVSKFVAGDTIRIEDANAGEEKTIDTIDTATKTITVTVNLANTYEVADGADVILYGGAQISGNVVILQDTVQNIASDVEASVIMNGVVNEDQIQGNLSNLTKADVQRLTFI